MIRIANRAIQIVLDIFILAAAFTVAFLLRFDWAPPVHMVKRLVFLLPYVALFQYLVLVVFNVHRVSWRHVGLRDARKVFYATTVAATALFLLRGAAESSLGSFPGAQYAHVPGGVIAIDFVLVFLGITGVRVLRRMQAESRESAKHRPRGESTKGTPTLLIGAGQAGVLVAREIAARPDLGIRPVGFLDDDSVKKGLDIHGIRVLGPTTDIAAITEQTGATQALITMVSVPGKEVRRVTELSEAAGLTTKIIPGVFEIVGGKINLSRIRNVAIEDLLGREPVELDLDAVGEFVRGKRVLVTGAGGSIGSELCRQVVGFEPKRLLLVDHSENSLFHINAELSRRMEGTAESFLADIRDQTRMRQIFERERPEVVFHAAAHKHVPIVEAHPGEAIKNNVGGTRIIADLADELGVAAFVMVSTDKAVNPTSVMGASKRVAEMYVQALGQRSETRFVTVRFGNVLGSAGSVVPIFKKQIERGGPVTVTHPDMCRYFMTIPEACQLVLQAATMGPGGEIFILDMGEPVKIVDLASDLIRLSGLRPGIDVEIEFTGTRPGEKLFEELSVEEEHASKTRHPKIYVGRIRPSDWPELLDGIAALEDVRDASADEIRRRIARLVPEYSRPAADCRAETPATKSKAELGGQRALASAH